MRRMTKLLGACAATAFFAFCVGGVVAADDANDGFTSIFNGKDLTGWEGLPGYWSVEDGCLTGATSREKPLKQSTYIFWHGGTVANFELRAVYRFTTSFGNSGIQFRSKQLPGFDVQGYQADMETGPTFTGVVFDVKRQLPKKPWDYQILTHQGQRVAIAADGRRETTVLTPPAEIKKTVKPHDWNEYVVIARGREIILKVNGVIFADVIDNEKGKGSDEGVIALQLHRGEPMKVQYKSILLKKLP